jgi:hypothetical protein
MTANRISLEKPVTAAANGVLVLTVASTTTIIKIVMLQTEAYFTIIPYYLNLSFFKSDFELWKFSKISSQFDYKLILI